MEILAVAGLMVLLMVAITAVKEIRGSEFDKPPSGATQIIRKYKGTQESIDRSFKRQASVYARYGYSVISVDTLPGHGLPGVTHDMMTVVYQKAR